MNILITGETSKIGQRLINSLSNQDLNLRFLKCDLLDQKGVSAAVENIDLIVHLAAITHSNQKQDYWNVNVKGTENLVEAAKEKNVSRIIFVSTRAISSSGGAYSQSKLEAEGIIKNSGMEWIILRPAEVYGVGKGMIEKVIELVKKRYFVPVIANMRYPLAPVYINDVINALKEATLRKDLANKAYTLAGPEEFSFSQLIEQICQFYQLKRFKIYLPVLLLKLISSKIGLTRDQLPRLLSEKSADISLAKKDLGFNPIDFQSGLKLIK